MTGHYSTIRKIRGNQPVTEEELFRLKEHIYRVMGPPKPKIWSRGSTLGVLVITLVIILVTGQI